MVMAKSEEEAVNIALKCKGKSHHDKDESYAHSLQDFIDGEELQSRDIETLRNTADDIRFGQCKEIEWEDWQWDD
jgi:hypothetical protein